MGATGKTLIPAQRRERIHEYLQVRRIARNADLCEMLDVSEATVRRDLERLEERGILERTHGGAVLSQRIRHEPEYALRDRTRSEEKRCIGAAAAALIEDGDVILVNSGTTTTQVIRHIPSDADVTVITNNVSAALDVAGAGFELILLGGEFQPRSLSVAGRLAVENLRGIYASKSFLGVDGISPKYGCTTPSSAAAEVVRLMVERTRGPVTVVADHSKWGVVSNFEIATVDQIHRLVTDGGLDESAHQELRSHSVEVIVAGAEPDSSSQKRRKDG